MRNGPGRLSVLRLLPSPPTAVLLSLAGLSLIGVLVRRLLANVESVTSASSAGGRQLTERERAHTLHSRPAASFVEHFMSGTPARASGVSMK